MEHVIVERTFDEPLDMKYVEDLRHKYEWCREQNRIEYVNGYLSADRKRMVCIYRAPDAESVRRYNRQAGLRFDAVWTAATVI